MVDLNSEICAINERKWQTEKRVTLFEPKEGEWWLLSHGLLRVSIDRLKTADLGRQNRKNLFESYGYICRSGKPSYYLLSRKEEIYCFKVDRRACRKNPQILAVTEACIFAETFFIDHNAQLLRKREGEEEASFLVSSELLDTTFVGFP